MPRKYELKQRARSQAETRARIVEATVALHNELGPARTTISAIAERAGVQRLTVYRHFPDERALYQACSGHWTVEHPRPDPAPWAAIEDPAERLQLALGEIYAYFRATENMTANVRRDLPELPVLQEVAAPMVAYWEAAKVALERGWEARGERRERLHAVIGHAIDFDTWRSLARRGGLDDAEVAELMARLARAV
ncbi:MAG TPA: helix-turn-helix domain-containing protein [Gaiellales bacterium]|jgi:AcrR family transcriptional regulator|nr:helix-turn-helix domain-containing protein [Gaiellales bacterium]